MKSPMVTRNRDTIPHGGGFPLTYEDYLLLPADGKQR
jgi:hypothetical protein